MMYCSTYFEKSEGSISMYSVIESKKICEIVKYVSFSVCFNEENVELHCTCLLFEFKGILCRHILSLLKLIRKTESVPSRYVFPLWRKDLKRRYTLVKSSYNDFTDNVEAQRLDKMYSAFYGAACMGVTTDDDFRFVMKWIHTLKANLSRKEISLGKIEAQSVVPNMSMSAEDDISKGN